MIKNRRSNVRIIETILTISQIGARKTEILYKANLSYGLLQGYLSYLLQKGFLEEKIEKNGGSKELKIYHTTANGNELLITIESMYNLIKNTDEIKVDAI